MSVENAQVIGGTKDGGSQSRWPQFAAILLACVTFPLIWVGGLVTTYDAGMAVPDWPTTYGYNMFLYPLSTWLHGPWGLFIEHGHRLLGSIAGILTILLNVVIWRYDSRRWMRWVGAAALLLVISQGMLGGLRVRLSSTDFARAHGMTGPIFFAFTIGICALTSRYWKSKDGTVKPQDLNQDSGARVQRKHLVDGWMLVGVAYAQLVLGAHLRHPGITWSPGLFRSIVVFHLIVAFLVLGLSAHLAIRARKLERGLSRPAWILLLLIGCQVALGFATWRAKYGWPKFLPGMAEASADQPFEIAAHNALVGTTVLTASTSQALTVTAHVALGSLILATGVWFATSVSRAYLADAAMASTMEGKVRANPTNPNGSLSSASLDSALHPASVGGAIG